MSDFDLTGKVALVTGGNGGIGLGCARGFAAAGAKVVITARNPEKNAAALAELQAMGAQAHVIAADITDQAAREALVAQTAERFGGLDILVNNAGVSRGGRPESTPLADWEWVLNANLTAVFAMSQLVFPHMKARGGGKIINIGSMYSLFASGYLPAYAASKGGLVQLTKSLAIGWAPDSIQVNAILPGWIETEMTAGAVANPRFNETIVARTPARRWGQPVDFAGPAVFLASKASDFVTGHSLAVDGGFAVSG